MAKLAEFLNPLPKGGTILINPQHICALIPVWDDQDFWTHTEIHMANGAIYNVNASFEQIEEQLAKVATNG